jgi:tripartite-type tricarboxylate transporter receptor subunit TctC
MFARAALARVGMGLIAASAMATSCAHAESAEDFFRSGRNITMYVGSGAGGGYDQVARLVARNLSRFLPGQPNIVVEDMPTAGGAKASNFVFNSAPRDGSVILAATNTSMTLAIYDSPVAHYDPRKFEWLGSTGKQQGMCVTWKTSPVKTIADAQKREVTVSASATNNVGGVYPRILNALLGTKFKVVSGYDTGAMELAVERGEVEGQCSAWETYAAIGSPWFRDHDVNILLQTGLAKSPYMPDTPLVNDLLKNPDDKAVLDLFVIPQEFGRPFVAPPGTPADRMALYRKAFDAMVKDPQFLAEAAKQDIIVAALSGQQVQALLARAYAAPKNIHDRTAVFAAGMD